MGVPHGPRVPGVALSMVIKGIETVEGDPGSSNPGALLVASDRK